MFKHTQKASNEKYQHHQFDLELHYFYGTLLKPLLNFKILSLIKFSLVYVDLSILLRLLPVTLSLYFFGLLQFDLLAQLFVHKTHFTQLIREVVLFLLILIDL